MSIIDNTADYGDGAAHGGESLVVRNTTVDTKETALPCEVCNGVRGAVTMLFCLTDLELEVAGVRMWWAEFCERHPALAASLGPKLQIGEYVHPTCMACQADMYIHPGQYRGTKPQA